MSSDKGARRAVLGASITGIVVGVVFLPSLLGPISLALGLFGLALWKWG
jgi:hypothetical protein